MSSDLHIKKEACLLIELCRMEFEEEQLNTIRIMVHEITDWVYFGKLANAHGVAALVWHNIEKHNISDTIPDAITSFLRGALMRSLSRNAFHTESIGEVLRILNGENIKTIILKGMALENSVYGNSGLRQMSDVDILIQRNECLKVRKILMQNGFESLPIKSVFHKFILTNIGKHLPSLIKKGASVEIHHELFGGKSRGLTQKFYESSYEIGIKGEKAWIAEPRILFLYLVKHLSHHEMNNESQLRLYTDLVVLIEKYGEEILNPELLKLSLESELQVILANHLVPLNRFWGINFTDPVNEFIKKYYDPESLNKFLFFLENPKDNPPLNKSLFYRQVVADIPGLHRKILFVLGDIFPSVKFMKNRYKCKSIWRIVLFYPHRVGKLLWLIRPKSR
jgi:hypothetical protein